MAGSSLLAPFAADSGAAEQASQASSPPPTTAVATPAAGATVKGTASALDAAATAATGLTIAKVQFVLSGGTYSKSVIGTATLSLYGYLYSWNTTTVPSGTYTLQSLATDSGGTSTYSAGVSVTVANTAPPTTAVATPAAGATVKGTASALDATATAATGLTIAKVQFVISGGTYSKSVIGTATLSLYGYLYSWNTTTVPSGTYTLQSLATDSGGTSTYSAAISVTVANTAPPTTAVATPAAGATLKGTASALDATATAATGLTIAKVQFVLSGGTYSKSVIGTATLSLYGYLYSWNTTTVPSGTYTLQSLATDSGGTSTYSAGVSITVANTAPPTTAVATPAAGATVKGTASALDATATAATGLTIAKVQFVISGGTYSKSVIGTATLSLYGYLYSWNTTTVPSGTYTLQSLATDSGGTSTYSAAISVTVANTAPPTTAVATPAAGATVKGTASALDATATAATGLTIAKVQFVLSGGTYSKSVIGTATLSLYGYLYSWNTTTVPSGTYTLQSLATDSGGTSTYSAGVSITVANTAPPTTAVATPAAGATVKGTASALDATATAATGLTIAKVQFVISGGTYSKSVIGTATLSLYGYLYSWNTTTVPSGTYTLQSLATDSGGTSTYSAAISVTVANTAPPTTAVAAPAAGATVKGTASALDATATAATGLTIAKVQFVLSGGTYSKSVIGTATLSLYGYLYSWNTTTVPSGTYTLQSLATDSGGTSTYSAGISVTVANTAFTPCTTLTANTVITAGTYVVNCTEDVPSGITLDVDPEVIFKFGSGDGFSVEGTLDAVGTATNPITFTSVNNNSVGGTTGTGSPFAGDWNGISVSGSVKMSGAKVSYAIVGVEAYNDTPAIENSVFDANEYAGVYVNSNNIDFDTLSGNAGSGNGFDGTFVSGAVSVSSSFSESAAWPIVVAAPNCSDGGDNPFCSTTLDVPSGVTLTAPAGSVAKFASGGFQIPGSSLTVEGTLVTTGTAASPAVFTSWRDNSTGTDLAGLSGPFAGDWNGISVSGSVKMSGAKVSYAIVGVEAYNDTPAIENSVFDANEYAGVYVNSNNIDFDTLSGNAGSGNGFDGTFVSGAVSVSSSFSESAAWPIVVAAPNCSDGGDNPFCSTTLDVPSGVTLTAPAGSVAKFASGGFQIPGSSLTVEGTLVTTGTAASPAVFTSWRDNSTGTDLAGLSGPFAGDWNGISVSGSVKMSGAKVSYAIVGVEAYNDTPAIENSVFDANEYAGVYVNSNNIDFDTLSGNAGSGNGFDGTFVSGAVSVSSSFSESAAWPIVVAAPNCSDGGDNPFCSTTLDVPSGVTLTAPAGSVAKFASGGFQIPGSSLTVEGTLVTTGTAASPAVFTSWRDNSTGTDLAGLSGPFAGDWNGISVTGKGSVSMTYADVKYPTEALNLASSGVNNMSNVTIEESQLGIDQSSGDASFRGTFIGNGSDIVSCDWGDQSNACSVDAAYTDWGSDNGPNESNSPPQICGEVTVAPWLLSGGGTQGYSANDPFDSVNCDGSSTPDQVLSAAEQSYAQEETLLQEECDADPQDCQVFEQTQACNQAALSLASSTADFPYSSPSDAIGDTGSALEDAESATVSTSGEILDFGSDIFGAVKDVLALAQAFVSCPA